MPDIPNWVTWATVIATFLGLIASLGFNAWQWHQASAVKRAFRYLLPAWSEWADGIRSQAFDYQFGRDEDLSSRVAVASSTIEAIYSHARQLSKDIERVALDYLTAEELAAKQKERADLARQVKEQRESTSP